jgi:hypothetical protein
VDLGAAPLALSGVLSNMVMAITLAPETDMTAIQTLAFPEENLVGWERALYAFLVEKQRRSGSLRTVQGYSSMLQDFFPWEGQPLSRSPVFSCFLLERPAPRVIKTKAMLPSAVCSWTLLTSAAY